MSNDLRKFAAFAVTMNLAREKFPEHAKEIDRAIYDVGRKLENCDDPNCTCTMNFENFHTISNENAEENF